MRKIKQVRLYHPQIMNIDNGSFDEILNRASSGERIDLTNNSLIIKATRDGELWIITIQNLKNDELPKVADSANGEDEQNLDIPDGKALSYKNIFVYRPDNNLLACAALYGHPQIGKLRLCLEKIAQNLYGETAAIRISVIFNNDLIQRIRNCQRITAAELTSVDLDGEEIDESRLGLFKEFLGGHNIKRTTKIKGLRGENIRRILWPIVEDFLTHRDDDIMPLAIKMEMDGEKVDFQKYYKTYSVEIEMDDENQKYVNYDSLEGALKNIIRNGGIE